MFRGSKAYNLKRIITNGKFETIEQAGYGVSLIVLPNGNFVYGYHQKFF